MNRPATLVGGALINVVIGISGIIVGLSLVGAMTAANVSSGATRSVTIVLGIPVYGLLAAAGGIGVWMRSRAGWGLAVAVDVVGLGVLLWAVSIAGLDGVLLFGVAVWGVALALLVTSPTRGALR
ncbi:MAG: hypothetical protein ACJ77F_01220 [Chloroflexota bacterium]